MGLGCSPKKREQKEKEKEKRTQLGSMRMQVQSLALELPQAMGVAKKNPSNTHKKEIFRDKKTFLATPAACESSQARDQTCTTGSSLCNSVVKEPN